MNKNERLELIKKLLKITKENKKWKNKLKKQWQLDWEK